MMYPIIGISACFALYILFIFFFAYLYNRINKSNNHFYFHQDILHGKKEEEEEQTRKKMQELCSEIEVLQHLVGELDQGKNIKYITEQNDIIYLPSGINYRFFKAVNYYPLSPVDMEEEEVLCIGIHDDAGKTIGQIDFEIIFRPREQGLKEKVRKHLHENDRRLLQYQNKLKNINSYYLPDIWSFWDFFYFSVSTQTTLGFGDILPNSKLVRKLITVQVFVGLAIVAGLINFVIQYAQSV